LSQIQNLLHIPSSFRLTERLEGFARRNAPEEMLGGVRQMLGRMWNGHFLA
jgi:hypothetical protein